MPEGTVGVTASAPTPIPGTQTLSIPQTVLSPPNSYQTGPTLGTSPHYTYLSSSKRTCATFAGLQESDLASALHSTSAPVHTSFLSNAPLGGGAYYRYTPFVNSWRLTRLVLLLLAPHLPQGGEILTTRRVHPK